MVGEDLLCVHLVSFTEIEYSATSRIISFTLEVLTTKVIYRVDRKWMSASFNIFYGKM